MFVSGDLRRVCRLLYPPPPPTSLAAARDAKASPPGCHLASRSTRPAAYGHRTKRAPRAEPRLATTRGEGEAPARVEHALLRPLALDHRPSPIPVRPLLSHKESMADSRASPPRQEAKLEQAELLKKVRLAPSLSPTCTSTCTDAILSLSPGRSSTVRALWERANLRSDDLVN